MVGLKFRLTSHDLPLEGPHVSKTDGSADSALSHRFPFQWVKMIRKLFSVDMALHTEELIDNL